MVIPPCLIHKLFRYRNFSETQHRRVPPWNFLTLCEKNFSTETLDTPLPLLSINFFATGIFLKHITEGFAPRNVSVLWDKKFWTENLDTPFLLLPPPPTLLSINFFDTLNQWKTKGFPYGSFRHCETKSFRRKILILPPLLSINFFATGNFLKHSTEGFPCEVFRHCETKNFWRKIVIPFCIKYRISGGIDVCKSSLETKFETVVLFLTIFKSWSKYLKLGENYAGASRPSCWTFEGNIEIVKITDKFKKQWIIEKGFLARSDLVLCGGWKAIEIIWELLLYSVSDESFKKA